MEERTAQFRKRTGLYSVSLVPGVKALKWHQIGGYWNTKKCVRVVYLHDVIKAAHGTDEHKWTVHYAVRKKDSSVVASESFHHDDPAVCQQWIDIVNHSLNFIDYQKRPKKILVFINPNSGNHEGIKIYDKKIKPLFILAELETHVIVTEDGDHAAKVLEHYDLSSIDGIAAAGGDGTLMQVVNGLQRRLMKDAGKDVNDEKEMLVTSELRIGVLATGSGQGMCLTFTATKDVVTSALAFIFGEDIPMHLMTAHSGGELMAYMTLMACSGFMADFALDAESRRAMGPKRYMFSTLKSIRSLRQYVAECYYLDDANSQEGSACAENWVELTGRFVNSMTFVFNLNGLRRSDWPYGRARAYQQNSGLTTIMMNNRTGRFQLMKKLFRIGFGNGNVMNDDLCEYFESKTITLMLPPDAKPHYLNLDGEVYPVIDPKVTIRFHEAIHRAFGLLRLPNGERKLFATDLSVGLSS